jgi:hypothetical protein
VNVTQTVSYNRYSYEKGYLIIAYSAAVAASTLSVLVGFRALYKNGVVHDTTFYSTLATTRNPWLDSQLIGSSLGSNPVPQKLSKLKLKFGVLQRSGQAFEQTPFSIISEEAVELTQLTGETWRQSTESVPRACFGQADQIIPIRKYQGVS